MRKRTLLLGTFSILAVGAITLTGVSLAAYIKKTLVDQNVSVANRIGEIIYFYPGEWDKDNALIKMFVCNNASPGSHTRKYISASGKTSDGYYIYNFPAETDFDQITFLRASPNSDQARFADNADAFVSGVGWNKTQDYVKNASSSWSSTNNAFVITGMGTARFIGSDSIDLGTISEGYWSAYGS